MLSPCNRSIASHAYASISAPRMEIRRGGGGETLSPRTARWFALAVAGLSLFLASIGIGLQVITDRTFFDLGTPFIMLSGAHGSDVESERSSS